MCSMKLKSQFASHQAAAAVFELSLPRSPFQCWSPGNYVLTLNANHLFPFPCYQRRPCGTLSLRCQTSRWFSTAEAALLAERLCHPRPADVPVFDRWRRSAGALRQAADTSRGFESGAFFSLPHFSFFNTQKPPTSLSAPPRIPLGLSEVSAWALSWGWAVIQTEAD